MKSIKALLDFRRRQLEDGPGEDSLDLEEPAEHVPSTDPAVYQLVLRKKRNAAMLKQMLARSGYSDLARMTSIKREALEGEDNVD